jgi:hypothetical protein
LNLLISEVAYAISNLPKTIIQIQQPMIDLYLAESSSMHRGQSFTLGWYSSLMGVLMGLIALPTRPSNLVVRYDGMHKHSIPFYSVHIL